jgi:hypothetical protein
MMAKQATKRREPAADLGPRVRVERGDVVTEFRADPDRPQGVDVKGGRVRVWYHVEWIEGRLSDAQHEAADRYLIRLEQAEGAKDGSPERVTGIGGHGFSGPTERQVMALADLRAANAILGVHTRLIVQTVGYNLTPSTMALSHVRDALKNLADHWGME